MVIADWTKYYSSLAPIIKAPYPLQWVDGVIEDGGILENLIRDGAITNAKINDLSWDKGRGGTLTLGGYNNVSGVLSVKDASAVEKVRLDNTGVKINSGKITLKNNNETTIIDSLGLVSLANFTQSEVLYSGLNQQITTAEPFWTDITNASFTFTLNRQALVLLMAKVSFWVLGTANARDALIRITINSENESFGAHRIWFRNPNLSVTSSLHRLEQLSAGNHTIKLRGTCNRSSDGTGILNIYDYYFSYIIFGK